MIFKQQGFSLLEVIISFVLLTFGIISLIKLQIFFDQRLDYATASIGALYAAESKLEDFRSRSQPDNKKMINFDSIRTNSNVELINQYYVTWQVVDKLSVIKWGTTVPILKDITVKAEWNDRRGKVQSVILRTMLSRYSEFD